MPKPFDVSLDLRVTFGPGRVAEVGELVRLCGAERAFVVTDPGISEAGITSRVESILSESDIPREVFSGVSPNPSTEEVERGGEGLRRFGTEGSVVVAVGGGSAMDAAKAISVYATNPYTARELTSPPEGASLADGVTLIAIPTTAGTAAETNGFGVITDTATHRKAYIGDESVKPRHCVLDPELTLGLPPALTAATGVDAMSHALESLMSRNSNPLSEALALQAVRHISRWLPVAVRDGGDLEARSHMLLASNLAGQAFATGTGLGVCHAIAHPLGARLHIPHGVAIARLLPTVMEFNLSAVSDRLALAAFALDPGLKQEDPADAVRAVRSFIESVLAPEVLATKDVTDGILQTIIHDALEDPVILNTPVMPTGDEVREMLLKADLLE